MFLAPDFKTIADFKACSGFTHDTPPPAVGELQLPVQVFDREVVDVEQREAPDLRRDGEGNLDEFVEVRLTIDYRSKQALVLPAVADGLARSVDVTGQGRFRNDPPGPHGIQEFVLADDVLAVPHHMEQQVEDLRPDGDRLGVARELRRSESIT
jgi:hypothetical protein